MQIFVASTHKPVMVVVLTFRIMNQLQGIFAFIIMATGCGAGLKYVYLKDTNVAAITYSASSNALHFIS